MANICEGSIKLRGKAENLIRFLTERLKGNYSGNTLRIETEKEICEEYGVENGVMVIYEIKDMDDLTYSITNSKGEEIASAYSMGPYNILEYDKPTNVIVMHLECRWNIDYKEFVKLAKKYKIDIRLYGIDRLSLFVEEYEILENGNTVKDLSRVFEEEDDFWWACPTPWYGG